MIPKGAGKMKINSFWFKYTLLMTGIIFISSIALSFSLSHFYVTENNKNTLTELKNQSIQSRNALVGDLKLLTSSLITWQSKKLNKEAPFSLVGVIDKKSGKTISVKPALSKALKNLKIPKGYMKKFPMAFYPLKTKSKKSARVLFLVDTDQIRSAVLPMELSKQKILFGLLSSKGFSLLSQSLKYYREAFLLDDQKNWMPIHSQMAYSGWFLQGPLAKNIKDSKKGWEQKAGDTLTVGVPAGISNFHLVFNKKIQKWSKYFNDVFYEILLVLFGLGVLMAIPVYLFINPLCSAYLYLARLLNRYAVWNVFPAPNHKGDNTYIHDIQPHLEKLYWQLREEKLSTVKEPIQQTQLFSEMVQNISKVLNYPHVQIKTQFESDIQIPRPSHWLEQSLIEILKNAAECMDENGAVEIHTLREKGQFLCRIRDYGPGMSPMMMNQVCKAYYSSKPKAKGLGLTLAYAALSRAGCPLYFSNAKDGQKGLIVEIALPEKAGYSMSHTPIYDSSNT